MLTDEIITGLRQQLLTRRRQLSELLETGQEAGDIVELDQTRVGRLSRMDAMQGQAMSKERSRRREYEMKQITLALARLDEGEYGLCLDCGEEIKYERLQLDPSITLCIDCANKAEINN